MMKYFGFIFICIITVFSSFEQSQKPVTITGIVTDKQTGRQIENAHVYIIHGEEEAMTERNGKFKIITWQSLPVKVYAEVPGYKKLTWTVQYADIYQQVQLSRK